MDRLAELFRLDGKTAVVTGGSRGIGLMIARGLLQAGARVYVCSRREGELREAAAALAADGAVTAIPADLGTAEGVAALHAEVARREDAVHLLVNNAGATWGAPLAQFPESGIDKVLDLNVKGVLLVTQALLGLLQAGATAADPARVINIGSVDGLRAPAPGMNNFSYSASKAAVHQLTRHLAAELAPQILVNAIAPGFFPSKMTKHLLTDGGDAAAAGVPLGRIGAPDDMAGVAVFLASRAGGYITGAVLPVDGGVATTR